MEENRYPKQIVVGDNGHMLRRSRVCTVVRKSLAAMKPGDRIVVSFTDEFKDRTPRRVYVCQSCRFADEFDRKTGRATVVLRLAPGQLLEQADADKAEGGAE